MSVKCKNTLPDNLSLHYVTFSPDYTGMTGFNWYQKSIGNLYKQQLTQGWKLYQVKNEFQSLLFFLFMRLKILTVLDLDSDKMYKISVTGTAITCIYNCWLHGISHSMECTDMSCFASKIIFPVVFRAPLYLTRLLNTTLFQICISAKY